MHGSTSFLLALSLSSFLGCLAYEQEQAIDPTDSRADSSSMDWQSIQARCSSQNESDPILYSNDYRWGYSMEEMEERFQELYHSPKRLSQRAYYDANLGLFKMPHVESWGGSVVLSERLITNVRIHIEKALERTYVQNIFFPDMGHSHLFVPQELWDQNYAGAPVSGISDTYTALFDDPALRILYHTAEQLSMLDDDRNLKADQNLQWRHYTRNIVGDNRGAGTLDLLRNPESRANTSRDLAAHHYIGAGFSVSANENGCFPFVHGNQTYFFDLSLFDAPLDPAEPTDGFE